MNLEFGLWILDFFDGLVGDDPQSVPAPVLQLDHDTLPGHGGQAIVCAPGGAEPVTLATLGHAPGIGRVLGVHHHRAPRSSVLQWRNLTRDS